jgi:hypothetical protein
LGFLMVSQQDSQEKETMIESKMDVVDEARAALEILDFRACPIEVNNTIKAYM